MPTSVIVTEITPTAMVATSAALVPRPGRHEDRRRVVDRGVDAGGLLHDREADADEHDPAHPRVGADVTPGLALVLGEVALGMLDDGLVLLLGRLRRVAVRSRTRRASS